MIAVSSTYIASLVLGNVGMSAINISRACVVYCVCLICAFGVLVSCMVITSMSCLSRKFCSSVFLPLRLPVFQEETRSMFVVCVCPGIMRRHTHLSFCRS